MRRHRTLVAVAVAGVVMAAPRAEAQMAVIDAAAIKQLVVQVNYWKQQITAMGNELNQLKQTHAALTGPRGMEKLLALTEPERNYLPKDWAEVANVLEGQSAEYAQLAAAANGIVKLNAVLTPDALARLAPEERESIVATRQSAAGLAAMSREAFARASARFAALAGLIEAIGGALDAKAIEDLQGRIAAEQAMLENEQAKLVLLAQAAEADRRLREQRLAELALAGHGDFKRRLHPQP
jgi:type IV secretion system protein VirB5